MENGASQNTPTALDELVDEEHFRFKMPLDKAMRQVQLALIQLQAQPAYSALKLNLTSAELNLVTFTEFSAGGEATVFVVTVAGDVAVQSTNTLRIALEDIPALGRGVTDLGVSPADTILQLGKAMFQVLAQARDGQPQLVLKDATIAVELAVNANGSIEVAAPNLLKTILSAFGFEAAVKAGAKVTRTSSITLNFDGQG